MALSLDPGPRPRVARVRQLIADVFSYLGSDQADVPLALRSLAFAARPMVNALLAQLTEKQVGEMVAQLRAQLDALDAP